MMVAISLIGAVTAVLVGRRLAARWAAGTPPWSPSAASVVMLDRRRPLMPAYNEVPADFPATVLYDFRPASLLTQLTLWAVLGVGLAEPVHRLDAARAARSPRAAALAVCPAHDHSARGRGVAPPRRRLDALAKPVGALGRLEDLAAWVAACQGDCPPRPLDRVRAVVLAGDHGVAPGRRLGLSRGGHRRHGARLRRRAGRRSVLARQHGVTLRVLDLGVDADLADLPGSGRTRSRRSSGRSTPRRADRGRGGAALLAGGQSPPRRSPRGPTC